MRLRQILDRLPHLNPLEWLRFAELALAALSENDRSVVGERLAEPDRAPATAVPLDDFLA